jgi:AcrR family transcriptional regulator
MDTKKKILDVALTLFSEKGYGNVFVGQIAEGVGIKAPSLYKHYKSKQDIFDAILQEMRNRYDKEAANLNVNGADFQIDSEVYKNISDDELVKIGTGLFSFFIHDEYECKFRKMLTLEQFSDKELSKMLSDQYFNEPLKYQSGLFSLLIMQGCMKSEDTDIMALQFFSPIYLLMTVCDREPEREAEALQMLDKHIRQFCRLYKGENTFTGSPDYAKE